MAFVGLVERMDASLCRFARAYLPAHAPDLCAKGAAGQRHNVASKKAAPDPRQDAVVRRYNKYDAALYEMAVAEFERREGA